MRTKEKLKIVKQRTIYETTDGKWFDDIDSAVEYEKMLQNPEYKKLKERVDALEREVESLQRNKFVPFQHTAMLNNDPEGLPNYQMINKGVNNGGK